MKLYDANDQVLPIRGAGFVASARFADASDDKTDAVSGSAIPSPDADGMRGGPPVKEKPRV